MDSSEALVLRRSGPPTFRNIGPDSGVRPDQRVVLSGWLSAIIATDISGPLLIGIVIFGFYAEPRNYSHSQLLFGLSCFCLSWILSSWSQSLYARETVLGDPGAHAAKAAASSALAFGITLLIGFSLREIGEFSRVWFVAWAGSSLLWCLASRVLWSIRVRSALKGGRFVDRAIVLGATREQAAAAGRRIEHESDGHIAVVSTLPIPGANDRATLDWLESTVRNGAADRLLVTGFEGRAQESSALLRRLTCFAVDITFIPNLEGLEPQLIEVGKIGTLPTIGLAARPLSALDLLLKRSLDVILSSLLLLGFLPVGAIVALAIKLDSPGPVFFRQARQGYHDRVFDLWKFRTMRHDAADRHARRQTSRNDDRVTRVGRVLRRFSLDELPQFLNVLLGDMSIVGPRPHAIGMTSLGLPIAEAHERYAARHRLKPGITGWAQINGCRGEIDSHEKLRERVRLDCYYIDHWSLLLDLVIIARTAALLLFDRTAY